MDFNKVKDGLQEACGWCVIALAACVVGMLLSGASLRETARGIGGCENK